jgi:tetratricopeptide (TPR) repeat protein
LVGLEEYFAAFPKIPGLRRPPSYYQPYRLDLGPRWHSQGIADNAPPVVGPQYVALVPQVGPDGMELAGIKLPEVAVPLATFTGWNLRAPSFSNTLRRNRGTTLPLPRTAEAREAAGDPRRSVEERYPDASDYLLQVVESLLELKRKRLLLDEDFARLLDQAARQAPLLGELRMIDVAAVEDGAEAAFAYYQKLSEAKVDTLFGTSLHRTAYDNNGKAYALMSSGNLEAALEVFKLNTMIAPDSWNVWDSLGECCFNMGRFDEAKQHYQKSLDLNPDNENGKGMLQRIRQEQDRQAAATDPH